MRFIVDDFYRDYYHGKMCCYLKEARSKKTGKILYLDELEEEEREKRIKALKPQNMSDNEWEEFVETVFSKEFRAKRLKMQEVRQKHTTHTRSVGKVMLVWRRKCKRRGTLLKRLIELNCG